MEKDLSLDLFIVLSRAYRAVSAHSEQDIRRSGLNTTEFGVLELLYHKGPHPLQQIGGKILLASGSITYVVDKLEQKGLLERKTCEEDRRITFASITESGTQLMDEIFPEHIRAIQTAVEVLSAEEKETAIHLLKKLGKHAQTRLP
ncbi:MarR family transcriptional regulator [Brevibacillus fluminis]|uniref:MarR family transcriptional regulator n=1 Tax=Brevibacillus fluminis TaxID=511487 RepID=A0A3M8DNR2_9BACL|nr:MarR family transcriptional regulator [Brevibacillus fluminis]RNB89732.1 MarR family transcriptional regulator [Brevibacillus fluminis]